MSYTLVTPATDKNAVSAALADATADHEHGATAESDEHLAAIRDAVDLLKQVVGRPGDQLIIEVQGHANPGHAPAEDVSDEVLHLTVRAVPAPVADVPA